MIGQYMERAATRDYTKDWAIEGSYPWLCQRPKPPVSGRPVTLKENYIRCVKGQQPYWMPAYFFEADIVWPDAIEEHPIPEYDGYDYWGSYWVLEEGIGGMITKKDTRVIKDFENWKEEVEWPNLDVIDFATEGAKLAARQDPDRPHIYESVEGITERLHELMPFEECLMAFYENPELLEEFHQKMADYKIETCKKVFEHYGRIDGVLYHDDWGTQRSGFYSNEMFREQIMPATKRFMDFLKEEGKFVELHSCGMILQYLPEVIEMGFDMWTPQLDLYDQDQLHEEYGKEITLTFPITIPADMKEDEIRKTVREFVDRYGSNGRVMAWIMTDMEQGTPEQDEIARDELYTYSLNYYNKLYGRD